MGRVELDVLIRSIEGCGESDKYAFRCGLFVLSPTDGLARIVNGSDFVPKQF